MARRIYEARTCLNYRESILSPYPILGLKLFNVMLKPFGYIEFHIDTGFEGSIMLKSSNYSFFQVGELPREYWRTYRTLAGVVVMRVSRAIVEVNGRRFETYVETPLFGQGKNIVGREFINKLVLILDGPRRLCCLD